MDKVTVSNGKTISSTPDAIGLSLPEEILNRDLSEAMLFWNVIEDRRFIFDLTPYSEEHRPVEPREFMSLLGRTFLLWDGDGTNSVYRLSSGRDLFVGTTANEAVFGGGGDDSLAGFEGFDFLNGEVGNDQLRAGDGNDRLFGGEDDDLLSDGGGSDASYGGDGDDVFEAADDGNHDVFDGGTGLDRLIGGSGDETIDLARGFRRDAAGGYDLLRSIEAVDGGDGNDRLFGTSEDDTLNGGAGADLIFGGSGKDHLSGGGRRNDGDVLFGGEGDDELISFGQAFGGGGNDVLAFGTEMTGGAGNDRFVIFGGEHQVMDYAPGVDVLDFGGIGSGFHEFFMNPLDLLNAMSETAEGLFITRTSLVDPTDPATTSLLLRGVQLSDVLMSDILW
ncbi:MAG: calcium-binding protein [Aestuariivirga sp.]